MPTPLFTVIMPVYNAATYVASAVGSVKAQTCTDWELLIVDDASTDDSLSTAMREAEGDSRIIVSSLPENSGGAFRPRLTALQAASGRYIVELDADDRIEPRYLDILAEALKTHKADAAFCQFVTPDGRPVLDDSLPAGTQLTGTEALAATLDGWRHTAMGAVRRTLYAEALERFGMPDTGMCSDEVLTRMILASASTVVLTEAQYIYTPNDQSVTRRMSLKQFDRIEGAFATLRLSNLVSSPEVWKRASSEFFHVFLGVARVFAGFSFETEADRNDIRQRLRNMYYRLQSSRFRRVIPLHHRVAMSLGFPFYMRLLGRSH